MVVEALGGTLLGGLFRLAPEVMKWIDRKDERKHELAMFDRNLEADKLKGQLALETARVEAEASIGAAEIAALVAATQAQGQKTGVGWVDAVNSLMRPVITFWWVIVLYSAVLVAQYVQLVRLDHAALEALLSLWGPDERAIVASIISFWFVDRSLRRGGGVR